MRYKLKICQNVVCAVKVFVVYFESALNWAAERFPHHPVNAAFGVFAVFAKTALQIIAAVKLQGYWPVGLVSDPRFPGFDVVGRCNADSKKFSNLFQRSLIRKHLLCRYHGFCGKHLASRYATHVAKLADLVQSFVPKNRQPRFHAHLLV
jgi:hypothetical protein